ncbi:hypothetical protein SeSPB_A4585 [Salmonella enterica subsp. enterica serovar Saintpaul str. SARA29]|nr:hypothetical protein SeSPB_A4585 [Salmonella enterica subsp. enterica serovar Saintpaul str. SARA29]VGM89447.1 hypothetical protein UPM517_1762 [Salmonella enterica subsp. enterica serovar Stanley]
MQLFKKLPHSTLLVDKRATDMPRRDQNICFAGKSFYRMVNFPAGICRL